ncbi:hypothetical protein Mgra_00000928 [Meloidogyne graminicola]|uniref:RING-type domain-containing protein n=1 Tax=Meloidogyne graminicola TaxID=189291 RepID=A0A8T0A0P3_9BILA|nr:hypothetical protein Mgra_00000928 [Meloidogyne graminicola]
MENIQNKNNKKYLPLELLFEIFKAANSSDEILNNNSIVNKTKLLKVKEFVTKFISCSSIVYAFVGKIFKKMFNEFKLTMICNFCLHDLGQTESTNIPICNHAFHMRCLFHFFANNETMCPVPGCNSTASNIQITWSQPVAALQGTPLLEMQSSAQPASPSVANISDICPTLLRPFSREKILKYCSSNPQYQPCTNNNNDRPLTHDRALDLEEPVKKRAYRTTTAEQDWFMAKRSQVKKAKDKAVIELSDENTPGTSGT